MSKDDLPKNNSPIEGESIEELPEASSDSKLAFSKKPDSNPPPASSNNLSPLETKLIEANSIEEAIVWTQIIGERVRQDDFLESRRHSRSLENREMLFKQSFSVMLLFTGMGLYVGGFVYVGVFVLGAGLYGIAPNYVLEFLQESRNKREKNNKE
jgi:hypothetical protein